MKIIKSAGLNKKAQADMLYADIDLKDIVNNSLNAEVNSNTYRSVRDIISAIETVLSKHNMHISQYSARPMIDKGSTSVVLPIVANSEISTEDTSLSLSLRVSLNRNNGLFAASAFLA